MYLVGFVIRIIMTHGQYNIKFPMKVMHGETFYNIHFQELVGSGDSDWSIKEISFAM